MTDGPPGVLGPATVVADRYRVTGTIGRGGMATVYRATDTRTGAEVAIKVLHPELAAMIGAERFAREVKITAQLVHPNIVAILDSGEHNGVPFYVMPFIAGETLDARLARERMLGVEDAVRIAADVATALAYAHELGYVHRDVKPSNILLVSGRVYLADFGVARAVSISGGDTLTDSGIAIGTAMYMSPEQAAGGVVDARTDIYSLGCVLFETLAGAPPFSGPSQAVIARHALDTAPSLLTIRPSLPAALNHEVQRALGKVPGDRHPSAKAFADAIIAARTDTRSAAAFAAAHTAPRNASRARSLAGAAAAVLIVAASAWYATRDRTPLDARRVTVFPFALPEGTDLPPSTGEDVATIVGSALGAAPPLKWVDGWSALDPGQRSAVRSISLATFRSVARRQRSRYHTTGRIFARGDSIAVALVLYDVAGDSVVAERTEMGGRAEPWRQALQAMNGLLPALIPNAARDVQADWLARPPAAVANFLVGESSFRRAEFAAAVGHFGQALHLDKSFALAAFRGAQAASWLHEPARGLALLDSVTGIALPPKYEAFAAGLRAYLAGAGDSAVASFNAAIAADGEFGEAWTQLGETYIHLLPTHGTSDELADSAFGVAHTIDPAAANVLFHLIEVRLRAGDARAARPLFSAYRAASADTSYVRQFEYMFRCVEHGGAAKEWHAAAAAAPQSLLNASIALAAGDHPPRCAWDMLSAILQVDTSKAGDNRRYFALVGRVNMLITAGKADVAIGQVDDFIKRWGSGSGLLLMKGDHVTALAPRARIVMLDDSAANAPSFTRTRSSTRLWMLGGMAVADGRTADAEAVRVELAHRADSARTLRTSLFARSLAARVALAAGDSARARAEFGALVGVPVPADSIRWGDGMALGPERLAYARLLVAAGSYEQAIAIAGTAASAWSPFLAGDRADALDICRVAAEHRGDAAEARRYAARLESYRRAVAEAAQ